MGAIPGRKTYREPKKRKDGGLERGALHALGPPVEGYGGAEGTNLTKILARICPLKWLKMLEKGSKIVVTPAQMGLRP